MNFFRRFFMIIMILSVFLFSQRYIWGNSNLKILSEQADTDEHNHKHSILNEISFFMTGFLIHHHEHSHDSDDRNNHDSRNSKTHSHTEISQLKTDFIMQQNYLFFSSLVSSAFGLSVLDLHVYDHPFQIFRPPIYI